MEIRKSFCAGLSADSSEKMTIKQALKTQLQGISILRGFQKRRAVCHLHPQDEGLQGVITVCFSIPEKDLSEHLNE